MAAGSLYPHSLRRSPPKTANPCNPPHLSSNPQPHKTTARPQLAGVLCLPTITRCYADFPSQHGQPSHPPPQPSHVQLHPSGHGPQQHEPADVPDKLAAPTAPAPASNSVTIETIIDLRMRTLLLANARNDDLKKRQNVQQPKSPRTARSPSTESGELRQPPAQKHTPFMRCWSRFPHTNCLGQAIGPFRR